MTFGETSPGRRRYVPARNAKQTTNASNAKFEVTCTQCCFKNVLINYLGCHGIAAQVFSHHRISGNHYPKSRHEKQAISCSFFGEVRDLTTVIATRRILRIAEYPVSAFAGLG